MGSLAARPGLICDTWLLSDRWPDTRTFASMAAGIFALFHAETEEQKAVAVYDWVSLSMRCSTPIQEGPFGASGQNTEPGRMFHVHGHHSCDGFARMLANIWLATGRPARKIVMRQLTHSVGELWYVDCDGVGRWHAFDAEWGWYVYDRSGTYIAGFAEIAADPTLMTHPGKTSQPFFIHAQPREKNLADMHRLTHGWLSSITPECAYYPHINLSPGQQWEIFYSPEGPGCPACGDGSEQYMLYLPLQRGMTKMEIAIPAEAMLAPCPPRSERPVVFYGTSITQGGAASRPGTNHVALIERHFDYPVVNLGFSGSGQMEPEVIDLVNELDGCLFVLDCLPNMVAAQVRERLAPAVRKIRASHPDAPIVVVDSVIYQDAYLVASRRERCTASNAAQQEEFAGLVAAGVPGLHYIQARELFTDADEATVDGTHPSDAGFRLMADAFIKALTPLMPDRQGQPRDI